MTAPKNPREISTEGLVIEHYLITLRSLEISGRHGMGWQNQLLLGRVRKDEIQDELDWREIRKRRAM